jgi:predicted dinucleotide-binding enzyme
MGGHEVVIGSRDEARAIEAATGLREINPQLQIRGTANDRAVGESDVVLLSVPYEGLRPTAAALASELAGKIVVSIVAPLEFAGGQPVS